MSKSYTTRQDGTGQHHIALPRPPSQPGPAACYLLPACPPSAYQRSCKALTRMPPGGGGGVGCGGGQLGFKRAVSASPCFLAPYRPHTTSQPPPAHPHSRAGDTLRSVEGLAPGSEAWMGDVGSDTVRQAEADEDGDSQASPQSQGIYACAHAHTRTRRHSHTHAHDHDPHAHTRALAHTRRQSHTRTRGHACHALRER